GEVSVPRRLDDGAGGRWSARGADRIAWRIVAERACAGAHAQDRPGHDPHRTGRPLSGAVVMTTGDGRHVVRWAAVVARLLLRVIAAGLAIGVVLMLAGFPDAGYVVLKVSLALLLCSPVL